MKCTTHDCKREALWRCYWPGRIVFYCTACKEKMRQVADAMGFAVAVEFVDQAAYDSVTTTGAPRDVEQEEP